MAIVVSLAISTKNVDMVNMTNQTLSAVTSFSHMTIVVEDVAEVKVGVMSLKMQTSFFLVKDANKFFLFCERCKQVFW